MKQLHFSPETDGDAEMVIDLGERFDGASQTVVIVKATSEGIIIDFYADGDPTVTIGRTYEEWLETSQ